jgi:hypothetical protein
VGLAMDRSGCHSGIPFQARRRRDRMPASKVAVGSTPRGTEVRGYGHKLHISYISVVLGPVLGPKVHFLKL